MKESPKIRCTWVDDSFPAYVKYHDEEWGVPVYDDKVLFEFLTLEGAQAGLSWSTILKKRQGYTKAFAEWDFNTIAQFTESEVQKLLLNPDIVRNQLKIRSTVTNAKNFILVREEFGSFSDYLWNFIGGKPITNNFSKMSQVPASTPLSDALSKDLKQRGFKFVGSTIVYAFMQAVGIVNDHTTDCYCYYKVST